jgi:hypothetical protein
MKYNIFTAAYIGFFLVLTFLVFRGVMLNPGDTTLFIIATVAIPAYFYFMVRGVKKIHRLKEMHSDDGSWE